MNVLENNKDWAISSQAPEMEKVQRLAGNGVDYKRSRNGMPVVTDGEDIVYSPPKDGGFKATSVYKISCSKTSKVYIGISSDVNRRFKEHLERSKASAPKQKNSKISRAIRKYGASSFKVETLLMGDRKYCCLMEVKLIQFYDSFNSGFNMSLGGEGSEHISPWNKGTKGLCKPNKTSLVPGGKSPRQILKEEDHARILKEYKQGIVPRDMAWLPVDSTQAYRYLRKNHPELRNYNRKRVNLDTCRLYLQLFESGMLQKKIALKFGVSCGFVSSYIQIAKADRLANESK